ncbi:lachesin precursor, putative [Pediculus humanus corporis]|uniref:Lachesin, putative n=1 Tax=Pediculus humanus subsp. corporis TaxID=121224 RepID=E0VAF5_PEDHC|nr:lachesin precursor, putative [Pediculus humanus corporis]EEB10361.1 lachesin precursor, putative [Pediculus humanus corporis]
MCQINTDPMKSQLGYLEVVVPPDFIPEDTSGDIMVPEGGSVKLTCKARGYPLPHVLWRREDSADIILREPNGIKNKVATFQGEILRLARITRSEMGAYLCIASNSIPPSVSKRIMVNVHFNPVIQVPNQLVGAPLATDVALECYVEASPKSINYWVRDTGEMVISSDKYEVQIISKSLFEVRMILLIRNFQRTDVGSYRCIAKNSLGEVDSSIRLYEIPSPTSAFNPFYDEEDYSDQYGSAEDDDDGDGDDITRENEQVSISVSGKNTWTLTNDNTRDTIKGTFNSLKENQGGGQIPLIRGGGNNRKISGCASSTITIKIHLSIIFSIFIYLFINHQ